MKIVFATLGAASLACSLTAGPASALPRVDAGRMAVTVAHPTEKARVVCNWRRCWHAGYRYRYYRPYGYYRPYYYGPRLGIGIGPFGVRIF